MPTQNHTYRLAATYSLFPVPYSLNFTFSAKERDTETGLRVTSLRSVSSLWLGNWRTSSHCTRSLRRFGSRYYSSDLSIWLSVDPQAAKYPSLSPYVYCANNPIKLVDPNGEDWYEDESGKMCYTDQITSAKAFKNSGIKGTYHGKTYTKDGQYYSLFGQQVKANSKFGKLTKKIDDAFINYANDCATNKDYDYAKNPFDVEIHDPVMSETDFTGVFPFVDKFGTTTENQHGPDSKDGFGKYANIADVYFYVTGSRMKGYFQGFSAKGKSRLTGGNGCFSTPIGNYLYISNTKGNIENRIVGLRFNNASDVQTFKNKFYRLFPNAQ